MHARILDDFPRLFQAQPAWCWAAATACIYDYFKARAGRIWQWQPQCAFVRDQMNPPLDGCQLPAPSGNCIGFRCFNLATSLPEHLDQELVKYGLHEATVAYDGTTRWLGNRILNGGWDYTEIRDYIDLGRPIALRVMVSRPGQALVSHFLIVIGYYSPPAERVVLWDPGAGERHVTPEEITRLYGRLEHRYLTRPPPPEYDHVMPPGKTEGRPPSCLNPPIAPSV